MDGRSSHERTPPGPGTLPTALTADAPAAARVLEVLYSSRTSTLRTVDGLSALLGIPADEVAQTLRRLEAAGFVCSEWNGMDDLWRVLR
jgi:hypothetical protein